MSLSWGPCLPFPKASCDALRRAFLTMWSVKGGLFIHGSPLFFIKGVCPRDTGLFPEVETRGIACRQPKLCVGYTKEPWKMVEKVDGTPAPQKMTGMRGFLQGKDILCLKSKFGLTDSLMKVGGGMPDVRLSEFGIWCINRKLWFGSLLIPE